MTFSRNLLKNACVPSSRGDVRGDDIFMPRQSRTRDVSVLRFIWGGTIYFLLFVGWSLFSLSIMKMKKMLQDTKETIKKVLRKGVWLRFLLVMILDLIFFQGKNGHKR